MVELKNSYFRTLQLPIFHAIPVIRAAQPTTAIPHATSNQPKESPPLLQIDEEAEKEQQKIREEKQRREEEEDEIECLGGDCPLFENVRERRN
jgi:hypothetical protein